MAGNNPDAWLETALVAISAQGGSNVQFASLTETIDIDTGEKQFDVITNVGGGRIAKWTPETETTITLEAYPLEAGTDTGTTGKGFFDLLHSADTSQPVTISNTRTRSKYRIAILWTTDTSATDATAAISSPYLALRFVAADGYFVSVKPSFTDGILKFTIVYKVPPFDKSGNSNIKMESVDGTATLSALASYTSSDKW